MEPVPGHRGRTSRALDEPVALGMILRRLWGSVGWRLSPDLAEDCLQEARLSLWRARHRLELLPDQEREAYAAACVRRAMRRVIDLELAVRSRCVLVPEAPGVPSGPGMPFPDEGWLERLVHPGLMAAVGRLPWRERAILHLYYAHGLTDREVAAAMNLSLFAVEQQRCRSLRKLRQALFGAS